MTTSLSVARPKAQNFLVCAAGCGLPLSPAAAEGGHHIHPGCESPAPVGRIEWRWGCVLCRMTGVADNADMAVAFDRFHKRWACPATAVSLDDPVDGFSARIARRANITSHSPVDVPAYDKQYRQYGGQGQHRGRTAVTALRRATESK